MEVYFRPLQKAVLHHISPNDTIDSFRQATEWTLSWDYFLQQRISTVSEF